MTDEELKQWNILRKQVVNGYHMEKSDYTELYRLNYLVMEQANKIHNDHMMDKTW